MAVLTNSGRIAAAESVMARPIHMAWGSGNPDWDLNPVPETVDDASLVDEIGRRAASVVSYCIPDLNGEIITPTGRFAASAEPTKNVYLRFNFDFNDAPSATIREIAVFVGTETQAGLPPGQMYFEPSQITDPGTLLVIERIAKIDRSASLKQSFEFVVTF